MKTTFAIPQVIIDCLRHFAPADRGEAFTAIFDYANQGIEPSEEMSPAARGAFEFARRIIDPILERRRKAAERRAAKKKEAEEANCTQYQDKAIATECVAEDLFAHNQHVRTNKTCPTKEPIDKNTSGEKNRLYSEKHHDIIFNDSGEAMLIPA